MNSSATRERTAKIAILNDAVRKAGFGGLLCVTNGVRRYGPTFLTEVMAALESYDDFTLENDPHGEHDFGVLTIRDHRLFWKIDYYDRNLEFGSENPADAKATRRVLTVMLAEEY